MESDLVRNKRVIFRDYVSGSIHESDMYIATDSAKIKLQPGTNGVLVRNLYLSCDPYMRMRMKNLEGEFVMKPFTPGSVCSFSDSI